MPEHATLARARKRAREGKSASTQAGEFIREEIHHVREGKHGARSAKQAIAIGLSKARRAGVPLGPPKRGSRRTRAQARRDSAKGRKHTKPSPGHARGALKRLRHEGRRAASHDALARHAKQVARRRSARERSAIAKRAARTRKKTLTKR
jgi:hypothetical protein